MEQKKIKIGLLQKKQDRVEAAKLLSEGQIIGVFNRGVCALWFDGNNPKAIKKIIKIKGGGRKNKSIALTLDLDEFIPLIDLNQLNPQVRKFLQSKNLKHKIGSLCFIRAPLKKENMDLVPPYAKAFNEEGVCMIQNWDSFGHEPLEQFLLLVKKNGVTFPAVTSMNISDQAEIVDQRQGEQFCKDFNIPIFLKDPKAHPNHVGSYTIFTLNGRGIKLERDGNIPASLFKYIFGLPINTKNAKPAKHPQISFPIARIKNLSTSQIRQTILLYIYA